MDMDISMDIHTKSVDMDMNMDGKFHIHGNPGWDRRAYTHFSDYYSMKLAISEQESPADAVKPVRRKSMQKLLQFDLFRFISPNSISPNFKV